MKKNPKPARGARFRRRPLQETAGTGRQETKAEAEVLAEKAAGLRGLRSALQRLRGGVEGDTGWRSLCGYFKINSSAAEAVVQMQDLCRS